MRTVTLIASHVLVIARSPARTARADRDQGSHDDRRRPRQPPHRVRPRRRARRHRRRHHARRSVKSGAHQDAQAARRRRSIRPISRRRTSPRSLITAELPAFAKPGMAFDITVSSIGNAKSLAGGTLLAAPLKGPDGKTWAIAQGALSVGGFVAEGATRLERRRRTTRPSARSRRRDRRGDRADRDARRRRSCCPQAARLHDRDADARRDRRRARRRTSRASSRDAASVIVGIPPRRASDVARADREARGDRGRPRRAREGRRSTRRPARS